MKKCRALVASLSAVVFLALPISALAVEEIHFGTSAGPNKQGVYPKGSVHRAVADRLAKYEGVLKGEEAKSGKRPRTRPRRK